jgi:predicted HTH transcriptional regulator
MDAKIRVGSHIIEAFTRKNNSLVTDPSITLYLYVQQSLSGNLHRTKDTQIQEDLGISSRQYSRYLRSLLSFGYLKKVTNNWYHITNIEKSRHAKTFDLPDDFFSNKQGRRGYLNSLIHLKSFKSAYRTSKKNSKKQEGSLLSKVKKACKGFQQVSCSFVKEVCHLEKDSIQTINYHLNRLVKTGFIEKRNNFNVHFECKDYRETVSTFNNIVEAQGLEIGVDNIMFRKVTRPILEGTILVGFESTYQVYSYLPNDIRILY